MPLYQQYVNLSRTYCISVELTVSPRWQMQTESIYLQVAALEGRALELAALKKFLDSLYL